ncbi:MAG TPA: hypothetical protein VNJ07_03045 [Chitinophagales bacterium]|nr:hypothetical protein [Chitinophagales bacterium]
MSRAFCTITTRSHLFKVYALNHSLRAFTDIPLHVLVIDANQTNQFEKHSGIIYHTLDELDGAFVNAILRKYSRTDHIRWCSKPVLLLHLLENTGRVIYLDNDLFFYHSGEFLFDYLIENNILLSPHWRIADPEWEQIWMITNFREGIYNAGFIGVNQKAGKTVEWWAKACLYRCERNFYYALFDDQKYLDIFPVLEPKTHVLAHKGCNVAGWNIKNCTRTLTNGEVMVNGIYPIVFIHYANDTFYRFKRGEDNLLWGNFEKYVNTLKRYKPDYDWLAEAKPPGWLAWFRYFRWRFRELFNKK